MTIALPQRHVEFMKAGACSRDLTLSRAIQELILREQARAQRMDIKGVSLQEVLHRLRHGVAPVPTDTASAPPASTGGRPQQRPLG